LGPKSNLTDYKKKLAPCNLGIKIDFMKCREV